MAHYLVDELSLPFGRRQSDRLQVLEEPLQVEARGLLDVLPVRSYLELSTHQDLPLPHYHDRIASHCSPSFDESTLHDWLWLLRLIRPLLTLHALLPLLPPVIDR